MPLHSVIAEVTERIRQRSASQPRRLSGAAATAAASGPRRAALSCGNLAHGFAACGPTDKERLTGSPGANIAIVTAYNDMLSAHQPYETLPGAHPRGGARGRRGGPVRGRRARHVRRRHPGPGRHGAVAVQPRRDRDGDRRRAQPTTCSTAR